MSEKKEIFQKVAQKYGISNEDARRSLTQLGEQAWLEAQEEFEKCEENLEYKQWREQNKTLREKLKKLIEEFYERRGRVKNYVGLRAEEKAEGDTELLNGLKTDEPWFHLAREKSSSEQKEQKIKLSRKQLKERKKRMLECQKEMREFGEYLKNRFFEE